MPLEFNQIPKETPKNNKIWFLIGLGILLIFINGWMLYQNYFTEKTPTQNLTNTTLTDEFADWKTYRNDEYRFEFKYPQKYDLYENNKTIQVITKEDHDSKDRPVNNLTIEIVDNDKGLSVLEWWNFYGPYNSDSAKKAWINPKTFPIEKIKIGWTDGIYIYGSEGVLTNYLILSNKNKIFKILVMIPEYQKILSTFRFISTSTANILPPDPGEAGKTTLEGIDSDKDGLRDDVQRVIYLKYKNSQKAIEAARDAAKALQAAILASQKQNNGGMSYTISSLERKAAQCILFIDPNDSLNIATEVVVAVLNTEERLNAYNLYENQIDGQYDFSAIPSSENRKLSCSFNPDLLSN